MLMRQLAIGGVIEFGLKDVKGLEKRKEIKEKQKETKIKNQNKIYYTIL